MAATSQKHKPILIFGAVGYCDLIVRPEDIQWTEPSRISVNNTLGDAWIDAFGPAVGKIVISGNTGWGAKLKIDWLAQLHLLHKTAFKTWHMMVESSKQPESVPMFFSDTLDMRMAQIVPDTFTMKRSKSRPLLVQYNISFHVVKDML